MEMNYCRRCGTELSQPDVHPYRCRNGHALYTNPAPTVGLFLINESNQVLLCVRAIEPNKGMVDSIGGFVKANESFEQAIQRETLEETGLSPTDYSELIYLTSAPNDYPFAGENVSVLSCFYYANVKPGVNPVAGDDVASLIWKGPEEIELDSVGDAHDVRAGLSALLEVLS